VSRVWSVDWGGYVIFDWDTFFAASLAAIGDRDLAYADAVETLRELTPAGFVPNYARAGDWKSFDRSEPPVGAITVLDLYRKFHDRWLLEDTFAPLLSWNRWWADKRSMKGYLVWGSDAGNQPANLDDDSRGTRQGAIFESGLDNSPMYDEAVFDAASSRLLIADVGLLGMYIADCDALAAIADTLGKSAEGSELRQRAVKYRAALSSLWSEEAGIFLNKDLRTGELSKHLSPTNFYPLLAHAATSEQADRMIKTHLLNSNEFWGEWVIPSIARNDPGFKDQNYWRGRIWGPMNFLVYLGLLNYDQPEVRRQLANKSLDLFLREWKEHGHVHENYNAILGIGDDVHSSDRFYHWGALLGLIQYMEAHNDYYSKR
jgi:putative isomerase